MIHSPPARAHSHRFAVADRWPSARLNSSLFSAMPSGTFTGVDLTEVYEFLDAHAPDA